MTTIVEGCCWITLGSNLQEIHFERCDYDQRNLPKEGKSPYVCIYALYLSMYWLGSSWVHMLKQTQPHAHSHIIERIITPLQILQTWSNEVLFSQTVWKVNCISVLVMVGSGAVCMYYLHLSDVVIEAQCCYESGWEANKCVSSLLMLKSDPVCTYLLWAACCLCP